MAWRQFGKVEGRLLYSDDFRVGGVDSPQDIPLQSIKRDVASSPSGSALGFDRYATNASDNNKNVLAHAVETPVRG